MAAPLETLRLELRPLELADAERAAWGQYPVNIGHTDFPGCWRCHDGGHTASGGEAINGDCSACHSLLAQDDPNPKVLTELGITEPKR